jgi:hypothetical protein
MLYRKRQTGHYVVTGYSATGDYVTGDIASDRSSPGDVASEHNSIDAAASDHRSLDDSAADHGITNESATRHGNTDGEFDGPGTALVRGAWASCRGVVSAAWPWPRRAR